jgi:hypothetical protein
MAGASWRGKRLGETLLWSRTGQAVPPSRADGDKGEPSDAGLGWRRDGSAGRVGKRRLGLPRRGPAGKG